MPQHYDPLSQEDDSHIVDVDFDKVDSPRTSLLPRPAVYYGEGSFDAPSSDEEDDVEVAEKSGTGSHNRAENGSLLGLELTDNELYVGGRKVCPHCSRDTRVNMHTMAPCRSFRLSEASSSP